MDEVSKETEDNSENPKKFENLEMRR
jgi:hypothetical protein